MRGKAHCSGWREGGTHAGPDPMPDQIQVVGTITFGNFIHIPFDSVHGPCRVTRADVVGGVVHVNEAGRVMEALERVARFHVRTANPGKLDREVQSHDFGQEVPGKAGR